MKTKIPFSKKELEQILNFSLKTADEAGKILLKYRKKIATIKINHKKAQGAVSEADLASEKYILSQIEKNYPGHEILAEEMIYALLKGKSDYQKFEEEAFCWAVDPLDGTHNFLSGSDYFAVCISLLYHGQPIVGVVYRPVTGDCFFATVGGGAYFENKKTGHKKVKLSNPKTKKILKNSILVTGFVSEKGEVLDQEFTLFKKILLSTRAIRHMGSAALDLCYVSQGIWDGFWEKGLAPWDVAAAGLIALESGLIVTNYEGCPYNPYHRTILASKAGLYKEFKKKLNK